MFSGSVARGVRQLTSQMNDYHRVRGNLNTGQNSAYDLLYGLLILYLHSWKTDDLISGKQKLSKKRPNLN